MRTYKPETVMVVKEYTCDVCGTIYDSIKDAMEVQEFYSHIWVAGYGSLLEDGEEYSIDICQKCFLIVFGKHIKKNGMPLSKEESESYMDKIKERSIGLLKDQF